MNLYLVFNFNSLQKLLQVFKFIILDLPLESPLDPCLDLHIMSSAG